MLKVFSECRLKTYYTKRITHLRVCAHLAHLWLFSLFSLVSVCVCVCVYAPIRPESSPSVSGVQLRFRLALTDGSPNASFTDPLQTKLCKRKSTRCPSLKSRTVTMTAGSEACQPHWGEPQRTLYLKQVAVALLPPIAMEELQNTDITTRPLAKPPKTATAQSYVIH